MKTRMLFLPGAGGSAAFWKPVAGRLEPGRPKRLLSWPGLGSEPPDPSVRSLECLVGLVLAELTETADLVAQSMGGWVALRAALAAPAKVRRLVLTAASGGLEVAQLGGADWRPEYRQAFPSAAPWILEPAADLSARLPGVACPCLLLWGDADPISPLAVGRRLLELLPDARLEVVRGGGHDLAVTHAPEVARLVGTFLAL